MGRDPSYPTLLADTGVVVKLFGQRFAGPESHRVERAAYALLDSSDLPVPELLHSGELYPEATGWKWPYLILSRLSGIPYAEVGDALPARARLRLAREVGEFLRRLHALPLGGDGVLAGAWERFHALLRRRRREAPGEYRQKGYLSQEALGQVPDFLPSDPTALIPADQAPAFVHGDLHSEHLLVDPREGRLRGVLDFTDGYAGDPRYDFLALHFGTFRANKALLQAALQGYGWFDTDERWARDMMAFTFLHDFDLLARLGDDVTLLRKAPDLESVARLLWDPTSPGLPPRRSEAQS